MFTFKGCKGTKLAGVTLQDGVIRQRGPGWQFAGMQMCFMSFLIVTGISKRKCQKFLKAIHAGQREPPEDGRSQRVARDVPKRDHARAFFQFLYDHLAEPLAEGDPDPEPEEETEIRDEFSYFVQGTRFSKMRREARTEAEKAHFTAAAQEHKQGVFSDRAVGRRLMFISENSTRQGEGYSPEHGVLYLSLDGMDQDFASCIRETVKPARERELHVECINAFYNWQEFLQPPQISLSGLAITEHEQEVNFSFRMVTRGDIKKYQGFEKWLAMTDRQDIVELDLEVDSGEGPDGSESDVFLLCKHYMHSSVLTQEPTLILPASRLGKLAESPTVVLGRNKFSDRQVSEFRKTARQIAEPPWSLRAGSEYLTRLCDDNIAERRHDPPSLIFFNTVDEDIADLEARRNQANPPEELLNFAPGTPRRVVANLQARPRGAGPGRGRGRDDGGAGRRGQGRGRKGGGRKGGGRKGAAAAADVGADGGEEGDPAAPADGEVPGPAPAADGDGEVREDPGHGEGGEVPALAPLAPLPHPVPKPQAKRGLKRPAAARPPAPPPPPPAEADAAPAPPPAGADAGADPGPDGVRRVRYKQSTIDKQTTLGCSKCTNSPIGCKRCREIHELWKAQQGQA
eukprot:s693_g19.t1